jgi:hypothetical protein
MESRHFRLEAVSLLSRECEKSVKTDARRLLTRTRRMTKPEISERMAFIHAFGAGQDARFYGD